MILKIARWLFSFYGIGIRLTGVQWFFWVLMLSSDEAEDSQGFWCSILCFSHCVLVFLSWRWDTGWGVDWKYGKNERGGERERKKAESVQNTKLFIFESFHTRNMLVKRSNLIFLLKRINKYGTDSEWRNISSLRWKLRERVDNAGD